MRCEWRQLRTSELPVNGRAFKIVRDVRDRYKMNTAKVIDWKFDSSNVFNTMRPTEVTK